MYARMYVCVGPVNQFVAFACRYGRGYLLYANVQYIPTYVCVYACAYTYACALIIII